MSSLYSPRNRFQFVDWKKSCRTSSACLDHSLAVLVVTGCWLNTGLYVGKKCIRLCSDLPRGGRTRELYTSFLLAYSRSKALFFLVLQSTYCVINVSVFEMETWLDSPFVTMNALGCLVCSSTTVEWMTSQALTTTSLGETSTTTVTTWENSQQAVWNTASCFHGTPADCSQVLWSHPACWPAISRFPWRLMEDRVYISSGSSAVFPLSSHWLFSHTNTSVTPLVLSIGSPVWGLLFSIYSLVYLSLVMMIVLVGSVDKHRTTR